MTRIVVLGSQGMLGRYLHDWLSRTLTGAEVVGIDRSSFQCTSNTAESDVIALADRIASDATDTPTWVFNATGLTNKIAASDNEFYQVNAWYSQCWNLICQRRHWTYVYFSTDCVFSGQRTMPHDEHSPADASDVYGLSKHHGECGMTIRVSIIGEDLHRFRGLVEFAKKNHHTTVPGFTHHLWNGVTCLALAKFCQHAVEHGVRWQGVRHLVPPYVVNKYDLLKAIDSAFGLHLTVTPSTEGPAKNRVLSTLHPLPDFEFPDLSTQLSELREHVFANDNDVACRFRRVMIVGGSGSLGQALVHRWQNRTQEFIIVSRSEHKQWLLSQRFPHLKFRMELADVSDRRRMEQVIAEHDPDTIVVAAALKHVDRCETAVRHCVEVNTLGLINVLEACRLQCHRQRALRQILYVSTDKACAPINVYGMSKSMGEHVIQNYVWPESAVRLLAVRYGNVINSSGSIIPTLVEQARNPNVAQFTLTSPDMTRYYMTLDESIQLIEDALVYGGSGEIWTPQLRSMRIADLMAIVSRRFHKPVTVTGTRPGEKLHESLVASYELGHVRTFAMDGRTRVIIAPAMGSTVSSLVPPLSLSSADVLIERDELALLLDRHGLLP